MRKGKISYNSLVRSVLRVPFERRESDHIGRDGAFSDSQGIALNTVVYGGDGAEELAFFRAYNSALAAGIEPRGVMLSLLFPAETTEPMVKACMRKFRDAAEREKAPILGGHTAFSDAVRRPVLTIAVTGERWKGGAEKIAPGSALLVTKTVGTAGARILLGERREELGKRLPQSFLDEFGHLPFDLSCRAETDILRSEGAVLHDLSEGGLLSALYELGEGFRVGFLADLKEVPLLQETVEICDVLGGDPFALLSTGCMLAAVPDGGRALERLLSAGIPAALIGTVTEGRGKLLKRGDGSGSLERPGPDFINELENFG